MKQQGDTTTTETLLTDDMRSILGLLVKDLTLEAISKKLNIPTSTVYRDVRLFRESVGVNTLPGLAVWAVKNLPAEEEANG